MRRRRLLKEWSGKGDRKLHEMEESRVGKESSLG
jgi:hypothetical protein